MASNASKVKRRAEALAELERLSGLLSKSLNIEVPDVRARHRDPELQSIQRVEAINDLLSRVLGSLGAQEDPVETKDVDLDHMKKAELLDLAKQKGVEVGKSQTKAEIIEALNG